MSKKRNLRLALIALIVPFLPSGLKSILAEQHSEFQKYEKRDIPRIVEKDNYYEHIVKDYVQPILAGFARLYEVLNHEVATVLIEDIWYRLRNTHQNHGIQLESFALPWSKLDIEFEDYGLSQYSSTYYIAGTLGNYLQQYPKSGQQAVNPTIWFFAYLYQLNNADDFSIDQYLEYFSFRSRLNHLLSHSPDPNDFEARYLANSYAEHLPNRSYWGWYPKRDASGEVEWVEYYDDIDEWFAGKPNVILSSTDDVAKWFEGYPDATSWDPVHESIVEWLVQLPLDAFASFVSGIIGAVIGGRTLGGRFASIKNPKVFLRITVQYCIAMYSSDLFACYRSEGGTLTIHEFEEALHELALTGQITTDGHRYWSEIW